MRRSAVAVVLLSFVGCGDNGPALVPVSGKVTLDGKPLALKNVRFVPEPGTPGQGAGANTDAEGRYTLLSVRPGATRDTPGTPPGAYKVVVAEPMFPIETKMPEQTGDAPAPAIGLPDPRKRAKPVIPAAYTSPEATPLKVTVPSNGGVIDLELKSK